MYFLREKSAQTTDPLFLRLPAPPASLKEPQCLLFPEQSVAKWFYESGLAERGLIEWAAESLSSEKVFVDIGAHVGTYTWMCGKRAAHTYAFECSPKTFCYLAANVALHDLTDKVTVLPYALGDKEGSLPYIVRSEDGGGNGVKVLSSADGGRATRSVPVRTLDSFGIENIGLIKIDVEGFEKEVLMGARETLERSAWPPILFECWGDWKEREGVPAKAIREELFAYLADLGYNVKHMGHDMWLASRTLSEERAKPEEKEAEERATEKANTSSDVASLIAMARALQEP